MGLCQSTRNLNAHIDHHENDKPPQTESGMSARADDEKKLKDEKRCERPNILIARSSIQSTSASMISHGNHHRKPTPQESKRALPPASSSSSSFSLRGMKRNDNKKRQKSENVAAQMQRRESLQRKISILTFASAKINQYKSENDELRCVNDELNEANSELKEYVEDKDDIIVQQEQDIKEMESRIMQLEQQIFERKAGATRSINDILYKVQGDTVSKLKYSKMSAKRVIFIAGMNDLFYYDETAAAAESNSKCIVVRDILMSHKEIESALPDKAWFLIVGAKRKALFIAQSMDIRDKWLDFIQSSLNSIANNAIINGSNSLNINMSHMSISTNGSDYLQIPRGGSGRSSPRMHAHTPNIVTSPRSGTTKIYIESEEFEARALCLSYARSVSNCGILNNGHTVQINIHSASGESNACRLSLNDDANMYRLKQFHFHTPSEHTIYSKQYEMELHLVHVNESDESQLLILCFIFTTQQKYKAPPQLQLNESKTHLLIKKDDAPPPHMHSHAKGKRKGKKLIGNILKSRNAAAAHVNATETEDDETDIDEWIHDENANGNEFLEQFWHQMPPKKTKEEIPLNSPLNFDFLFKTASDNFIKNIKTNEININIPIYDYVGSLRTPPYTPGVKWLISKKTHFINYKQLNTLKKIWYHYL